MHQLHGDVEDGVDEEVGHDHDQDVVGGIIRRNVENGLNDDIEDMANIVDD